MIINVKRFHNKKISTRYSHFLYNLTLLKNMIYYLPVQINFSICRKLFLNKDDRGLIL